MQIRTAVIGYGLAGRVFHTGHIAADRRYTIAGIVTGNAKRQRDIEQTYGAEVVLADPDELFGRAADIDLVVIASPNDTHLPLARRALELGLHVVVDKPLAATSGQARKLVELAAEVGRTLTVFQNRRWDGDFLTVRRLLRQGRLGEVRQFESAFEWWKPDVGATWKDTTPTGGAGGILYDLGPHLVDQALQLFGAAVDVHGELDTRRSGAVSDDDSFLTIGHRGGVRSRLWMSAVAPANRPRFRVVGSKAVFTIYGLDPQERQLLDGMAHNDRRLGHDEDNPTGTLVGPNVDEVVIREPGEHARFYRRLADHLIDGAPVPVAAADSIDVLNVIERARLVACAS